MNAFETEMALYRRNMELRDWQKALLALDRAIELAPCTEALPTLMAYRDYLVPKTQPKPWYRIVWG